METKNNEIFEVNDNGVFSVAEPDEKMWLSSRIDVVAKTRSEQSNNWGRRLLFKDPDGVVHEWAMPMSLLAGDGSEVRSYLLDCGLQMAPGSEAKKKFMLYLQTAKCDKKIICVSRVGWHRDMFVMPDCTFGGTVDDEVRLQTEKAINVKVRTSGTLEEWRGNVAQLCVGNSRLIFAVSAAFAGPLLTPLNEEGGGFHFRGPTSVGKTTALRISGSVWGGGDKSGFIETWRSTSNGLEAVAGLHCDSFLPLDELSQIEPKHAGEVAYLLANGKGKNRASRIGMLRTPTEWKLLFLSTGEIALAEHMLQAGEQIRGGQDVRMLDIPADAGVNLGLFENLHSFSSGDAFARHIQNESSRYYGTAIRRYLETLTKQKSSSIEVVKKIQQDFVHECEISSASGEVSRAASRFGLIAAAGELVIRLNIVPWSLGSASVAVRRCFDDWVITRGGMGNMDDSRALAQVRSFFQEFGTSRFPLISSKEATAALDDRTPKRAGFRVENLNGDIEWVVFPEVYRKEICKGFDSKIISKILIAAGHLATDGSGKSSITFTVPGIKTKTRVYKIKGSIMGE